MVGRLSVLVVAIVAIAIAWHPNDTILNLVGNGTGPIASLPLAFTASTILNCLIPEI